MVTVKLRLMIFDMNNVRKYHDDGLSDSGLKARDISDWRSLRKLRGSNKLWNIETTARNMDSQIHTRTQRTVETMEWPALSGIHKVWSTSITRRKTKRSRRYNMMIYWAYSMLKYRKNGFIRKNKVHFHYNKLLAHIYAIVHCYTILRILFIWLCMISFCFQKWKRYLSGKYMNRLKSPLFLNFCYFLYQNWTTGVALPTYRWNHIPPNLLRQFRYVKLSWCSHVAVRKVAEIGR